MTRLAGTEPLNWECSNRWECNNRHPEDADWPPGSSFSRVYLDHQVDMGPLGGRVDTVEGQMEELRAKVASNGKRVAECWAAVVRLEGVLAGMKRALEG